MTLLIHTLSRVHETVTLSDRGDRHDLAREARRCGRRIGAQPRIRTILMDNDLSRAAAIRARFENADGGLIVVAHRGCHNPSPDHDLPDAPENSLQALEHCVRLNVDMMETDVRAARDGTLVLLHDETVDRMTDGTGRVSNLTWTELQGLRLRRNAGGRSSPGLTSQRITRLEEILDAARGRLLLNIDVQEGCYRSVAEAVSRSGMERDVLIKAEATIGRPLAELPPYRSLPFMPVLRGDDGTTPEILSSIVAAQASTRRIAAVEVLYLDDAQFDAVRGAAAAADIRVWVNTLDAVDVVGLVTLGGDVDALRDRGETWRALIRRGASVIQTDEPASLIAACRA